ncbi:ABC transporter ATP-binding protein [Actinomyces vulturis]|uniref:ABC transporter ATP-binding protein n=1 Tax=Actinomyces vulturis TaxID=1857645 RepID=UPI000AD8C066|nr:ABC transporter ATP-binding protein [Actinomyces vulturis]
MSSASTLSNDSLQMPPLPVTSSLTAPHSITTQLFRLLSAQGQEFLRHALLLSIVSGIIRGCALVVFMPASAALMMDRPVWGLTLHGWLMLLAIIAVLSALCEYLLAMANYQAALDVMESLHAKIGEQVARLPLGYFTDDTAGKFSRLVTKQMMMMGESLAHMLSPMVMHVFTMLVLLAGCWVWSVPMGLILTASIPVMALAIYASRACERHSKNISEPALEEQSARLVEFTQHQPALRACGQAKHYAPLHEANEWAEHSAIRGLWWGLLGQFTLGSASQTIAVLAMVIAVSPSIGFSNPVATIVFIGIMLRFTTLLSEIGGYGMGLENSRPLLNTVNAILDEPVIVDPLNPRRAIHSGAIAMEHVTFGYTADKTVLHDVSFEVQPGSMTAIVGPSGCGKTTLARLLARFYPVTQGRVLIGGVDVTEQRLEDVMGQISWVFQDVYLYDDTLFANIAVGNKEASKELIEQAAALAGVDEIVQRLPQGWDTPVGEGGRALSGGERQRVSIARAVLKNAPIMIVDEATSALDPANEQHVMACLEHMRKQSTLIVIAHKLSTITSADTILVLNSEGRVEQCGSHHDLVGVPGTYHDFWQQRVTAQGWSLM